MTRLEVVQAPLGDLRPYPGNARRHDVDAIAGSLRVNGQFRPLVVQRGTSHVLGGYDEPALADLLSELDGFDGTGYAEEDLTDLLAALEPEEPTALIPEGREPRERTSRDRPEYEESYSSVSTRFIPLNYPLAQYVWLTDALAKIAEEEGVDGPEGAVLRLVELRVLEHAPTPETEAATA
jgi:hypothetical protein